MLGKQLQMAAAGNAGGEVLGIEDVFSTYLYTGNSSTQTITNGIDLAGEGGMVWTKQRAASAYYNHSLYDTIRGTNNRLFSNTTNSVNTASPTLTAFNANGFTLGSSENSNQSGDTSVSWTFRKAEKFFDVVTWSGNEGYNRQISHSLGSTPGCIIVKCTNTSNTSWLVWHRNISVNDIGILESSAAITSNGLNLASGYFRLTNPTSTTFTVNGGSTDTSAYALNRSGRTYVAYVFAHDAGGFGDGGTESVIKCGSYTGNGSSSGPVINLGWEPQWLMIKRADNTSNWNMFDNMRGMSVGGDEQVLSADLNSAEYSANVLSPLATGFQIVAPGTQVNASGGTYIYIAIRRGPMKTPTDATTVFSVQEPTGNGSATTITTGFPVDLTVAKAVSDGSASWWWVDRLRGETNYLSSNSTNAETTYSSNPTELDNSTGVVDKNYGSTTSVFVDYLLRRSPGFFDMVTYTGTGADQTINHKLGVVPELIIVKCRSSAGSWPVYSEFLGATRYLVLNSDSARLNMGLGDSWSPTSTTFNADDHLSLSDSGQTYIAYLFATVPGVSKVGGYSGTGGTQNIDCGFTAGARFVMIKRTDTTRNWFVWDTARGIVIGNDPRLHLNDTQPENTSTDVIDPYSAGFQVSGSNNGSSGNYLFLAIA